MDTICTAAEIAFLCAKLPPGHVCMIMTSSAQEIEFGSY